MAHAPPMVLRRPGFKVLSTLFSTVLYELSVQYLSWCKPRVYNNDDKKKKNRNDKSSFFRPNFKLSDVSETSSYLNIVSKNIFILFDTFVLLLKKILINSKFSIRMHDM